MRIRRAPQYVTDEGQPGVWYWLDLDGAHELLDRIRIARALLAGDASRHTLANVAEGLTQDSLGSWLSAAEASLVDRPHVRILPMTVGQMARSSSTRLLVDAARAKGSRPADVEVDYARSLIREQIPEVRGIEGVGDDGEETWEVKTGTELVELIDCSGETALAGVIGELVGAITDASLLRPGLGEASAWRRAG